MRHDVAKMSAMYARMFRIAFLFNAGFCMLVIPVCLQGQEEKPWAVRFCVRMVSNAEVIWESFSPSSRGPETGFEEVKSRSPRRRLMASLALYGPTSGSACDPSSGAQPITETVRKFDGAKAGSPRTTADA